MDKVRFSEHAKCRFCDRFPQKVKEHDGNKILAMCNSYYNSTINNSIKNDTMFTSHVYENHGYEDFAISVNGDIVFIVKDDTVVTVLPAESYIGKRVVPQNKSGYKK